MFNHDSQNEGNKYNKIMVLKWKHDMSQPVQHHYLPQQAYLKFFESSDKEGLIWLYQRGQEPILIGISNAAKERHLYSFKDNDGKYNTDLEMIFAQMEQRVISVIKKLNDADRPIYLSGDEKSELAYFIAMQVARTPAFRDLLKRQAADLAKIHLQMIASNEEIFSDLFERVKKDNPGTPNMSFEEIHDFAFSDRYTVEMKGEGYFLRQALLLGDSIFPTILMKDWHVLRSVSTPLITCDYPVNLITDPAIPPMYAGGFLMARILFPIGSNTAIYCRNPQSPPPPPKKDDNILIGFREIPPVGARWINKVSINSAERFLFGSFSNQKIKKLFDETAKPKRFSTSSPFSNIR